MQLEWPEKNNLYTPEEHARMIKILARIGRFYSVLIITLIAAVAMVGRLNFKWIPLLRFGLISIGFLVLIIIGTRAFYNNIVVAPYKKAEAVLGLEALRGKQLH